MPPDNTGTLERIAIEIANALVAVPARFSAGLLEETLAELGIAFPGPIPAGVSAAANNAALAAAAIPTALDTLITAVEDEDETAIIAAGVDLVTRIGQGIAGFTTLGNGLGAAGVAVPPDFAERVLDLFILDHLDVLPAAGNILTFLGIIDRIEHAGVAGDPTQPPFTERRIRWQRLLDLLSDPAKHFRTIYDWDAPGFTGDKLLGAVHDLIARMGLPALLHPASPGVPMRLEAFAFDLTPTTAPPGLNIDVLFPVGGSLDVPLAMPHPAWTARMKFDGQLEVGASATLRPPFDLNVLPGGTAALDGAAKVTLQGHPASPMLLFGESGGSRLQIAAVDATVGVAFTWSSVTGRATVEPLLGAGVTGGRLVIDGSQGDGFIAKILSGIKIDAPFDLAFTWSLSGGLQFKGSGMLEIEIPLNLSLGPVEFIRAYLGVGFSDGGRVPIELAAAISAEIGPVSAAVDHMGLLATLSFPPGGGNLGPAQMDIGFKPPTGVGLAVEAGPVSGGGFISFDLEHGRYAGVLALDVFGVKIRAIGLIDTKLPDGRPGYSFLIIITVEFTPIQLGYGFTLNGVGGLAGIHRTIDTDALRTGIYAGSLDSILFPQDPVRNAPQIISDISRIFPVAEGQFVFGPMAKIGWGASIIQISLGIIIELPDPIRIALLGQIGAFLPEQKDAIVEVHIDFVALIDFGAKLLSLDATLRDSRIVVFTLTGDMAMRLCWGDEPNFAIALGGFHPAFAPPPGFPALRRLTLALGMGDWIRISCQTYMAVTTNSVQFGARAELYVNVGVYVHGWLGFDALIIFSPFSFQIDFTAGLEVGVGSVKLASVSVEGSLSGPTPWRVRGKATLSLLFFEITASFDEHFGRDAQATLPPADPWPDLLNALKDPRNWSGLPAAGVLPVVTLAAEPGTTATLIDPAGRMTWKETVAPLDRTLTRYANSATPAPVKFTVDKVTVGSDPGATFEPVMDSFAAAQFEDLSDAEKLSRPSFERMQGGIEVGANAVEAGPAIAAPLTYETEYKDAQHGRRVIDAFVVPLWMQRGALTASAARTVGLVSTGERAFSTARQLTQNEEQFVVVSTSNLAVNDQVTAPTTKGAAHLALKAYLAARPGERDTWQVVPVHELKEAA
jgi:hypothetical protein